MAGTKGKKTDLDNKGGRPAFYSTPEELQSRIDEYFETEKQITICGLALFLGFASRQSFLDYAERPGFSDIVKRAKLRVEQAYEKLLQKPACTGAIFVLKNMGWEDKSKTEADVKGEITIVRKIIHKND